MEEGEREREMDILFQNPCIFRPLEMQKEGGEERLIEIHTTSNPSQ